jgi:hypothetical protein
MFTFPYLGKRYGTGEATAELTKAMKDMRKMLTNGMKFDPDLSAAITAGQDAGFLTESIATELAAIAEGSNLQRLLPGSFIKSATQARLTRNASEWGAYMFQKMEQFNRYQTFIAAYRLHRTKMLKELGHTNIDQVTGLDKEAVHKQAYLAGRESIEKTQFEYARWNRPKFMRGRPSSLFLFKMYTQNALYFVATDPAKMRYLGMLVALSGLAGIPGSDDLLGLGKIAAKGLREVTGREDIVLPNVAEVRAFIKSLNMSPDLLLHGISHDTFNLWDLSGSIGQGKVIPGIEPIGKLAAGKGEFRDVSGEMFNEILGPAWNIPIQLVSSLSSGSPDRWREWEKALPKALASVSKAYRWAERGYASNYAGHPTGTTFDLNNPHEVTELVGQSLGFTPTRLVNEREQTWERKSAAQYWTGRRRTIMQQFSYSMTRGNRETQADMKKAVHEFNRSVPDPTLKIGPDSLQKSVKGRYKAEVKTRLGLPSGRQGTKLYQKFADAWEEDSP